MTKKELTTIEQQEQNKKRYQQRLKNRENCGDTKTFKYGCLEPVIGLDIVNKQISSAHKFYNKLIEIYREETEAFKSWYRKVCPELEKNDQEIVENNEKIKEIYEQISNNRVKQRKKIGATPEQKKKINDLKQENKKLREKNKIARKELRENPINQDQKFKIQQTFKEKRKNAGQEYSLYWPIRDGIKEDAQKAKEKTRGQPRFKRYDGTGYVCTRIQYPKGKSDFSLEDLFNCKDTRLRLEPVDENVWNKKRGDRKRETRTKLWMRVGSDDKRKPQWIVIPIIYHRPLPEGVKVKKVTLHKNRVGTDIKWSVSFQIEYPGSSKPEDLANQGAVAIDYGWRLYKDRSLRVAVTSDVNGNHMELRLPPKILGAYKKSDDIQSKRNNAFNKVKEELNNYKKNNDQIPDWVKEELSSLHNWTSEKRLAKFVLKWRNNRFDGDSLIFELLDEWRKRDKHLYLYQSHSKKTASGYRKDIYYNFVSGLRKNYKYVIIEGSDLSRMAQLPNKTKDDNTRSVFRYDAKIAAIGELFQILKYSGMEVIKVDPKNSSKTCSKCGKINKNLKDELNWTCEDCDTYHDRDYNSSDVHIARGLKKISEIESEKQRCSQSGS